MSAIRFLDRFREGSAAGPRGARRGTSGAFTLIEIMIAISIVAVIVAAGVPGLFRTMQKSALHRAVSDIMEGCSHARAQAILQGAPSEFRIRAEDGLLEVPIARRLQRSPEFEPLAPPGAVELPGSSGPVFSRHLDEDIAVEFLDVNFKDRMEDPEARVRFYPNGTSDEFTIIVSSMQGSFKISLDLITGLATSDKLR